MIKNTIVLLVFFVVISAYFVHATFAGPCEDLIYTEILPDGSTVFHQKGGYRVVWGPGTTPPPCGGLSAPSVGPTTGLHPRPLAPGEKPLNPPLSSVVQLRPGPLPPAPRLPNGSVGFRDSKSGKYADYGCGTVVGWTLDGEPLMANGLVIAPRVVDSPPTYPCK
jgi:hypothetical protein